MREERFSLKEPIRWGMVITILLCLITIAACNPNEKEGAPETPELYENYLFEKLLYINPLSSFYISDGYVEYYTFSRDALVITDKTGLQRNISVHYKKVAVDTKDFKAAFKIGVEGAPDITKYKERYQYTLNEPSEINPVYRLYLMDNEVWLASMSNGSMWTIYKLTRYNGKVPRLPSEDKASAVASFTGA